MCRRAGLLGLFAAAALALIYFHNLYVWKNTNLGGSYLPVGAVAAAFLFRLVARPLRSTNRRRPGLAAETTGALAVLLFAFGVIGAALLDHASTLMMMPHHLARTHPSWQGDPPVPNARTVRNWRALARCFQEPHAPGPAGALARRVPADLRDPLAEGFPEADKALQETLLRAVVEALTDPHFTSEAIALGSPRLPPYARRRLQRPPLERTAKDTAVINRLLIEQACPEVFVPFRPAVLDLVPPHWLADPSAHPDALDGFVAGLGGAGRRITWRDIPWRAWWRPMAFWGLMGLAWCATVIGLALVLHRQWQDHEALPYPTVDILRALLPSNGPVAGERVGRRLFWAGFWPVFALQAWNYAQVWWPDYGVACPLRFDFHPFLEWIPRMRVHFPTLLFQPTLYISAFAFAYFLANDVGFSLGAGPYLYASLIGGLAGRGIAMSGGFLKLTLQNQWQAGAYAAWFLVLLYSGRRYFAATARRALGLPAPDPVAPFAVVGARISLAGFAVVILLLIASGVEPALAMLWSVLAVMVFTVLSRLLVEGGVFYMHPVVYPCVTLWAFLGSRAAGYEQLLLLGLATAMMLSDPKDALMPLAVTALRLGEAGGARPGGVARWGAAAALLALPIGFGMMLFAQYQYGAISVGHPWMWRTVPAGPFERAAEMMTTLDAQGALADASSVEGLRRFREASSNPSMRLVFAAIFVAVLLCAWLRRRHPRWPFHPLMFAVMGTYQSALMAFSFLVGWGFKQVVQKYGGAVLYQRLKPFMIGLAAGEILVAALPMVVGGLYSLLTGRPPPSFRVLPG